MACPLTIRREIKRGWVLHRTGKYAVQERGSNENANRMIRRFIPKGCDISKYSCKQIHAIEEWLNNYHRKILNFETAKERFGQKLVA